MKIYAKHRGKMGWVFSLADDAVEEAGTGQTAWRQAATLPPPSTRIFLL